jgi:hypothetical protein
MRCNVLDRLQKAENCRVALLTERRTHKPLSQLERTTYILNAELLFLWFVIKVEFVWSSWHSSRGVRREYQQID